MYNAPPPNLMNGIHLVQSGRTAEGLAYLRHAAQTEILTAEGWLWLAAATDNLEEYRHCVSQALMLDPRHPIAGQMRADLELLDRWGRSAPSAGPESQPAPGVLPAGYSVSPAVDIFPQGDSSIQRPARRRRGLILLVIAVVAAGVIAALVLFGLIPDGLSAHSSQAHRLDFTVGQQPGYRFQVEAPPSWVPANLDDSSWLDRRGELIAAFPGASGLSSAWEQVETSFSAATVDPFSGRMVPLIRVVETDERALKSGGVIPALTLREIMPFPSPPQGTTAADACGRMRLVEDQFRAGGNLTSQPDMAVVEEQVITRQDRGDCVFRLHRRYLHQVLPQTIVLLPGQPLPDITREITLAVPVGADRYALWQITFADSAYGDYEHAVDLITRTLEAPART